MTSTISANATGLPAARQPSPRRKAKLPPTPAALRSRIEAAVDRLIRALDALDDDPDLEPSVGQAQGGALDAEGDSADDEPSIGACEGRSGTVWTRGVDDLEPSLGFLEWQPRSAAYCFGYQRDGTGDQTRLCDGDRQDHEDEHDGREPDDEGDGEPDEEPSLGSIEALDQTGWSRSGRGDREQDAGDEGELVHEDDEGFDRVLP